MGRVATFEKNKIDFDSGNTVTITPTDAVATDAGSGSASYIRNRDNASGWATTGSTDAAGTTLNVQFGDQIDFDTLFLMLHNFKSYTLKYYDSSAVLTDFSPPISVSGNTGTALLVGFHQFQKVVGGTGLLLTITGTLTADDDKFLAQLIVTLEIGRLMCQPFVQAPMLSQARNEIQMASGKRKMQKNAGWFECTLVQDALKADWVLVETLYAYNRGFLLWLNGNDDAQFVDGVRVGYRRQDIYLVDFATELTPEYGGEGRWGYGMNLNARLVEICT